MQVKHIAVAAVAAIGLGAAGCSTQPATDVGPTAATLNGRLVNPLADQTLDWRFELKPSFFAADTITPTRIGGGTLAAGADWTDVSARTAGLLEGTEYSYQVCGQFKPSLRSGCLPPRTFVTPIAPSAVDEIRVGASTRVTTGGVAFFPLILRASGGTGDAKGRIAFGTDQVPYSGTIACARVSGNTATVNLTGSESYSTTLFLKDNAGEEPDTIRLTTGGVSQRERGDCAPERAADKALNLPVTAGRVVIADN